MPRSAAAISKEELVYGWTAKAGSGCQVLASAPHTRPDHLLSGIFWGVAACTRHFEPAEFTLISQAAMVGAVGGCLCRPLPKLPVVAVWAQRVQP